MPLFLVTGGAGFIGSNLVAALLARGERVRVLDDLSAGRRENLSEFASDIQFIEGSVCDPAALERSLRKVDFVLHHAALPSVPRSLANPVRSNQVNLEGTLRLLLAAREAGVRRVVLASSSSVYGLDAPLPTTEDTPPNPVSPYAVSKLGAELYGQVFARLYEMEVVSLRYFNVFGPRQDPDSPYAAVIPRFIRAIASGDRPIIHGDGDQARDFTYVDNAVSANLLVCDADSVAPGPYNIAAGASVTVLGLVLALNELLGTSVEPTFTEPRPGDIRVSNADISKACKALGYSPLVGLEEGLRRTLDWYRTAQETERK